jgi:DNA-directed RNA polymerase specialized sigma24 family protein
VVSADVLAKVHASFLARCLELTEDPAKADDLAQDVYLQMLLSPPRAMLPAPLLRWLRTTARNLTINRWRRPPAEELSLDELDGWTAPRGP